MRKKLIMLKLLLIIVSCKGQEVKKELTNTIKKDTMEYFDVEYYKKLENDSNTGLKVLPNGNSVQYFTSSLKGQDSYIVLRITKKNSPITEIKIFFEKNKALKIIRKEFYDIPVGFAKEYDETGRLIKETNYDKNYQFSIDDLIKKMKDEYKVDLMNTKQTRSVSRNNNEYFIVCDQQARNTFYNYLVDGTTGETLSIKITDPETDYEKIILDKKAEAKQKEAEDNSYFKTYKGKKYTKKEWEVFEDEWHKNYEENKNKGFWDDIFPSRKEK